MTHLLYHFIQCNATIRFLHYISASVPKTCALIGNALLQTNTKYLFVSIVH